VEAFLSKAPWKELSRDESELRVTSYAIIQEAAEPTHAWEQPSGDTASSGAPPMGIDSFPTC